MSAPRCSCPVGCAWPLCAAAPAARAQALVADLTSHLVAITTGFTGTSVVLFGATDGRGDVIVVVRGPERDIVVRHKSKVAGVWVNTRQADLPQRAQLLQRRQQPPLEEIAPPAVRQLHQIGLDQSAPRLPSAGSSPAGDRGFPHRAHPQRGARGGSTADARARCSFLGDRLFRTAMTFPANVPTGTYLRPGVPGARQRRGERPDHAAGHLRKRHRRRGARLRRSLRRSPTAWLPSSWRRWQDGWRACRSGMPERLRR